MEFTKQTLIQKLNKVLSIHRLNELDILVINHPKVKGAIALQGAQLLSWQPKAAQQDVIWLSKQETFKLGSAIRGGIPLCYPWFGGKAQPSHGFARISLWDLVKFQQGESGVTLGFSLENELGLQASLDVNLSDTCQLTFTHHGSEPAQLAYHTYFNISDISQVAVEGLPAQGYDNFTKQEHQVSQPLTFTQPFDTIFTVDQLKVKLNDLGLKRQIKISSTDAPNAVVWNPFTNPTSNMDATAYKQMLCVEGASITKELAQGQSLHLTLEVVGS